MNKRRGIWIALLLLIHCISSCTVEKRRYTGGFHVEWNHRHKHEITSNQNEVAVQETVLEDTIGREKSVFEEKPLLEIAEVIPAQEAASVSKSESPSFKNEHRRRANLPIPSFRGMSGKALSVAQATPSAELNPTASVFGIIAFVLGILTLLSIVMALIVTEGWAALGWVAVMVIFGALTAFFGIIAQIIFWSEHQGVPWFQWLPLLIGGAAIVVLVKVLTGK